MTFSKNEIEKVSMLPPFDRYKYFIKMVADSQKLYALVDQNGDWELTCVEDRVLLSLWPGREYAERCLVNDWAECRVEEFSLDVLFDLREQIEQHAYLLNIFSVGYETGFVVEFDEYYRDILLELSNYE